MGKKKRLAQASEALVVGSYYDPERASQAVEGRKRSFLEAHEEVQLHEATRHDLHHLKLKAAETLEKGMDNAAWCPRCNAPGLVVDRTAIVAALGVLDRTGFPMVKGLLVEERRTTQLGDKDLLDRAVQALKVLEPDDVAAIVAKLVELRPEVREPIVKAVFGQAVEVVAS